MTNEDIFEEANNYFRRNGEIKNIPYSTELLSGFLKKNSVKGNLLEIGCCYGYNLAFFYENNEMKAYGIEPSGEAISYGIEKYSSHIWSGGVQMLQGLSDEIAFDNGFFDVVSLGFCFYQVDRCRLSKTISEIDRVLKPGGFLALTDFDTYLPYTRENKHNKRVPTYKMNYAMLFTQIGYSVIEKHTYSHFSHQFTPNMQERLSTQVLYKETYKDQYHTI